MSAFLSDGYQTLIAFAPLPGLSLVFHEKEVTPPPIEVGEIDTTTMRNVDWHTKVPKALTSAGDVMVTASYDPSFYFNILSSVGIIGLAEITFPDGTTLNVYCWIDKFTPSALKEGDFPLAELKFVISNNDGAGNEIGPS